MPGTGFPGGLYPGQYASSVEATIVVTGVSCTTAIGTVIVSIEPFVALPFGIDLRHLVEHRSVTVYVTGVEAWTAIGRVVVSGQAVRRVKRKPKRQRVTARLAPAMAVPVVFSEEAAWFAAADAVRLDKARRDDEDWLLINAA